MEQLPVLHKTFPDATLVITHRDPVEVISSIVTMLAYGDRIRRYNIDTRQLAEYWIDRIERLLKSCLKDRKSIPESQSMDLLFKTFMQDDMAAVHKIYSLANLPMPKESASALENYISVNARGKHGRMEYRLEEDFGINTSEIRQRFSFYYESLDVQD